MIKIDVEQVAQELDFEREDIEMLIEVFLESANEQLSIMQKGIEKNDFDMIYKAAHAIKGSSANLLLDDISNLSKQIELEARQQIQQDYHNKYTVLKKTIETMSYS